MLSKLTSKNQITIPKEVLTRIPDAKYFDVAYQDGVVVLKPVRETPTDDRSLR